MSSPFSSTEATSSSHRQTTISSNLAISRPIESMASEGSQPGPNVPKRGARACTACRKGKNRCEGDAPCRRCQLSGTPCVFEKPEKKAVGISNGSIERVNRLEGQYLVMQSQMIGLQSSLDRILATVQHQQHFPPGSRSSETTFASPVPSGSREGVPYYSVHTENQPSFPPMPGFPAPQKFSRYGIPSSTAASSDDESEENLSRPPMNTPIEALQGLANVAAEAAAAPLNSSPRINRPKKRKRVASTPRNAFPNVLEKGMVSDAEARELYHIFFSGCHLFVPLFDPSYDTYDGILERSPFCLDAILAVASKIRSGNGPPTATFYKCLEEAQGIARSTLFSPVVRKEAVQAMLLIAAWGTSSWLLSGHAMRMALELGLNRSLEKLAERNDRMTEEEERNLVISARIWLCLYWFDHQMSLGTGRPIFLRDESSIKHCRLLLSHPMGSPTDVRLVAQIELIVQKTQIYETLSPISGQVNHSTLAFIRRANIALDQWFSDCDDVHRQSMDEDSILRKILHSELFYAKLWVACIALRGLSWDKMPFEQRELALQGKEAAANCLNTFLTSTAYRAALRYSVYDTLFPAAFSGLFLLKVANLFPTEVDIATITNRVEQLAQLLSDVAAERYAITLRLLLANVRRKMAISSSTHAHAPHPQPMQQHLADGSIVTYIDPSLAAPIPTQGLGFTWHTEAGSFTPSTISPWLQEASLNDLGFPINGSDGILQIHPPSSWGDYCNMPEVW